MNDEKLMILAALGEMFLDEMHGFGSGSVSGESKRVSTWELIPLTGAQQTQILNRHNVFRSNLARGLYKAKSGFTFAKATNMRKLVWNYTLVLEAATYAETCPPNAISNLMVNKTVNTWANQFFTNGPKGYVTTAATAHATQMAWSTTQSIGCAYVLCGNFSGRRIVVCQYYPPGNITRLSNKAVSIAYPFLYMTGPVTLWAMTMLYFEDINGTTNSYVKTDPNLAPLLAKDAPQAYIYSMERPYLWILLLKMALDAWSGIIFFSLTLINASVRSITGFL
ncbi:unnamed protein product, partial [Mesorhabditis belari]|uniref:SCP domain-containing protein n=1 Tax=Mesorhabditis belari TaxID=2138241 RepID=A0AAF3J9E8_9BILA